MALRNMHVSLRIVITDTVPVLYKNTADINNIVRYTLRIVMATYGVSTNWSILSVLTGTLLSSHMYLIDVPFLCIHL